MRYISPQDAISEWSRVEGWLDDANKLAGGKMTTADYLVKVLTGTADLWVGNDMAVLAEMTHYPRARVYVIVLAGGEGGHDWSAIESELENAARLRGCNKMEVFGRPGWKRILNDAGYRLACHVWTKELS